MTTFGGSTIPPLFGGGAIGLNLALVQTLQNWASPSNYTGRSSMTLSLDGLTITEQSADYVIVPGFKLQNFVPASLVWSWRRWTRTISVATGLQTGESSQDISHVLNLNVGDGGNVQKSTSAQNTRQGNTDWFLGGVVSGSNPVTQPAPGNSFFCFGSGVQSTMLRTPTATYAACGDHVVGPINVVRYTQNIGAFVSSGLLQNATISASIVGIAGNDPSTGNVWGWRSGDINAVGGIREVVEYTSGLATVRTVILPNPGVIATDGVRVFLGRYAILALNSGVSGEVYDMDNANALVGSITTDCRNAIWVGDNHLYFPSTRQLWQLAA